jgi:hypothetical protein
VGWEEEETGRRNSTLGSPELEEAGGHRQIQASCLAPLDRRRSGELRAAVRWLLGPTGDPLQAVAMVAGDWTDFSGELRNGWTTEEGKQLRAVGGGSSFWQPRGV